MDLNQASDLVVVNPVLDGKLVQMKALQYQTDLNYVSGGGSEYIIGG